MPPTTFGDAEAAVCAILRADDDLSEFNAVIATDLVGYTAPARRIRVVRTGGIPTPWMRVDNPAIDIEARAEDKETAYDLAAYSRAAVFAARGAYVGHGLSVYDVADADGPTWTPNPDDPAASHYVLKLALVTRPA